jgi:hypothetical protein
MKNTRIQNLGIAVASVLVCFSLGAGAARAGDDRHDDNDKDGKFLLISFDEMFTSGSTIDGMSTLAGAFSDEGTRHEDFTTTQNGNEVTVTGTVRIVGSKGTLTTQFTGVIPAGSNPTYIEGTEYITGGTGVYAGARGKGTFEATLDFNTGKIVGVAEMKVQSKK